MVEKVTQVIIVVLFIGLMIVFLVLFILIYQRRHKRHRQEKQLLQAQFEQEMLKAQLEIQEHTFNTISQEIHDNVGQVLSLAKLNVFTMNLDEPVQLQQKIDNSKTLLAKAIADLRQLARSLHSDRVAQVGLQQAIADELGMIQNTGVMTARLDVTGTPYRLDARQETILFRIAQEALHNAVKYSHARTLTAVLQYAPGQFTLLIQDDGVGFDLAAALDHSSGIGLKNIRHRAALIGATLQSDTAPGRGCGLKLQLQIG